MPPTRVCTECPNVLVKKPGPGRWKKFCSPDCKRRSLSRNRSLRENDGLCSQCGGALPRGWTRKYCSSYCRSRAAYQRARVNGRYEREKEQQKERQRLMRAERSAARPMKTCPYCSQEFRPPHPQNATCGSSGCRRQHNNQRAREFMRRYKAEHGVSYTRKYRNPEQDAARFAALEGWAKRNPDQARRRKQEAWQRRRARKQQAPCESFRHEDVYERDCWVCQLCTKPVDPEVQYPDPLSASLDHIIPFARGGHHLWENVQLAHLTCNMKKHARTDWTPEAA